jgi:hypothetical protein
MIRSVSTLATLTLLATCTPPRAQSPASPGRLGALSVRAEHPRVWLDPERVAWLRAKVSGRAVADVLDEAGPSAPGLALASVATGDPRPCRAAFELAVSPGTKSEDVALVYDWCHDRLSADQRAELQRALVPAMRAWMADGRRWRSFHNGGHAHALRLTLAALALYGDDPFADRALSFLRPELEDILETLERLFPDGEWAEGFDYARHASFKSLRTFLAIKSATGRDVVSTSTHFRHIADYIFHATKPNGLVFPGDDDDFPYLSGQDHAALLMVASAYRDPYAQWFVHHCPAPRFQLEERDRWMRLLWHDPSIPERPLDALPLARIFRGKGLVLARTSWRPDDPGGAWVAFTNGDYFGDHVHLDVNAFQIYGGGELAIDSGRYDDDWDYSEQPDAIARSQFFNYYQRTIAHNTMLVRDPDERFGRGLLNDGGQRHLLWRGGLRNVPEDYAQGSFPSDDGTGTCDWATNPGRWERGDITAYTATPDFVFVRGDGTRAYAQEKVSSFVRELVFVRPGLVVVFDRVVSTNPAFEKTWLLHTIDEPRVAPDGSWFEVVEGQGRLFGAVVLPEERSLTKVGGPGDEFLVDGVHFAAGPRSALAPSELHYGEHPGAWRIEERPTRAAREDVFANVMLITGRGSAQRPSIEPITNDAATLALRVKCEGLDVTLRFAKQGAPRARMTIDRSGRRVFDGDLPDRIVLEDGRR